MKKFFIVLLILALVGGSGFAGWYFLLREDPLMVEFYGDSETISYLSGEGNYKNNDIVVLSAQEREGYDFESWIKDGSPISSSRIYSFAMSEKTSGKYTAKYRAKEFNISTQNNGVYNVSNKASTDEMVEININPPVGYEVDEIYYVIEGSDEKIVIQNNSFKMPPNHISIFINLKETKYTINYSLDGGEFDNTPISYYTVNTPTFNLPAPTKEGYVFLGWTDKYLIDPTLSYTVSQGSTKNISVEANWEIAKYNVTVEIIGEGSINTASLVEYNHEQYYDMGMSEGWRLAEIYYIKAGDTEKVMMGADIFIMPASDITIYAVFEKIPYDITILQEGSYGWIEIAQTQAYIGDTITIVAHPEIGCELVGYKYKLGEGGEWIYINENTFVMESTHVVVCGIFAALEYRINYVLNGGTLPQGAPMDFYAWTYITLPTPTKVGYYFIGWYDNAEFTGEPITDFTGYDGGELRDRTFYAYFDRNQYTVAFLNYDGTPLSTIYGPWYYGDIPYNWGDEPTKPSTLEYDFVFAGWTPEIVPVTTDTSYTAVFTPVPRVYNIKIANNIVNGSIECATESVHSQSVTVTATPDIGFELDSVYYIKAGDGIENKVEITNSFVMPKSDITIYAIFSVNFYPINYVLDGGTLPQGSVIDYSVWDGIITLPTPIKAYYDFAGWYDNAEFTGDAITSFDAEEIGGKTYYAKYTLQTIHVLFYNYDGSLLSDYSHVYGDTPSYLGPTPTKPSTSEYEYTFAGWTPEIAPVTGPAEYTATYTQTARTYNITVPTINNVTIICPTTAKVGDIVEVDVVLPENYYTIVYYYTIEGNDYSEEFYDSFVMPAGNVDIYMEFGEIPYYSITLGECSSGSVNFPSKVMEGQLVTLTVTANPGFSIDEIYCEGENSNQRVEVERTNSTTFTFYMPNENIILNAYFLPGLYFIETSYNSTQGNVSCEEEYTYGAVVYVSATPNDGYQLARTYYIVEGTNTEVSFTNSFTMPAGNITIYAEFELIQRYSIGILTVNHGYLECVETAVAGSVVQIISHPDDDYKLSSIMVSNNSDGSSIEVDLDTLTFIMPQANVDIAATFVVARPTYSIYKVRTTGGTFTCESSAKEGDTITVRATANNGYSLASMSYVVAGTSTEVPFTGTFTMPAGNVSIRVIFNPITYSINYTLNGGTLPANAPRSYTVEDEVTLISPTQTGYDFVGWIEEGGSTPNINMTIAKGSTGAKTFEALWERATFNITAQSYDIGLILYDSTGMYEDDVYVSVIPNEGYQATRTYYIVEGTNTEVDFVDTFPMPAGDVTIYAEFARYYNIAASQPDEGEIICPTNALAGEEIEIIIAPYVGYEFVEGIIFIGEDDVYQEVHFTETTFIYTMPAKNIIINALFKEAEKHNIQLVLAGDASLTASVDKAYYGEWVTLTLEMVSNMDYALQDAYYFGMETKEEVDINFMSSYAAYDPNVIMNASFDMPDEDIIIYVLIGIEYGSVYNITTNSTSGGSIQCIRKARYRLNTHVDVFADEGYILTSLYYIGETSGERKDISSQSFTMPNEDITIYAEFELPITQYSIAIQQTTNGTISCISQEAYEGDRVSVTITPDEEYDISYIYFEDLLGNEVNCEIIDWTDDNVITFIMPASDIVIYADFEELIYYPISVAKATGGSVVCATKAQAMEEVSFEVIPDSGYELQSLTVKNLISGNSILADLTNKTFTMPSDVTADIDILLIPVFTKVNYTISTSVKNGTINIKNTAIYGEVVEVTFAANENYIIATRYYVEEGSTEQNDFINSFTMPAGNITVYVEFVETDGFTITKTIPASGDFICQPTAKYNETVVINLSMPTDATDVYVYYIEETSGNMETVYYDAPDQPYVEFTMPNDNITLYVEYVYYIGLNPTNCTMVDGEWTYAYAGEEVGIAVHKYDSSYQLYEAYYIGRNSNTRVELHYDGSILEQHEFSFTMPAEPIDVYIKYADSNSIYNITVEQSEYGTISCKSSAMAGDTVAITASPNDGFELASIVFINEVSGEEMEVDITTLTFVMPDENITIKAYFNHHLYTNPS